MGDAEQHELGRAGTRWKRWVLRGIVGHLLGWLVTTQQTLMVVVHAGWVLLCIVGLQEAGGGTSGPARTLVSLGLAALRVLGAVDAEGHGGKDALLEAWWRATVVLYAVEWLVARLRGPQPPWSAGRKVALSTGIAAAGWGIGCAAMAMGRDAMGDWLPVALWMVLMAAVGTAWWLGVSAAVEGVRDRLVPERQERLVPHNGRLHARAGPDSGPRAVPHSGPHQPSAGVPARTSLGLGALVMVLAMGAAVVHSPHSGGPLPEARGPSDAPPGLSGRGTSTQALLPVPSRAGRYPPSYPGDDCRGVVECERRCQEGEPGACNLASELYADGLADAPRDAERSDVLMERGCALGDGTACMRKAAALEQRNTPADILEADRWYRRACELGHADGCAGVAYVYEGRVHGPPADLDLARSYFALACELGKRDVCRKVEGER